MVRAMRLALDELATHYPDWLKKTVLPHWFLRYARSEPDGKAPDTMEKRESLALAVGEDGFFLLDALRDGRRTPRSLRSSRGRVFSSRLEPSSSRGSTTRCNGALHLPIAPGKVRRIQALERRKLRAGLYRHPLPRRRVPTDREKEAALRLPVCHRSARQSLTTGTKEKLP